MKSTRKAILRWASAALCFAFLVSGPQATAQRYTFQSYAQRDGLRNLNFNCLLQDQKGTFWACTEFGLYRYDGSRFELSPTVEGSSSPMIQGIAEDSAGRIWASSPQRLIYRDSAGVHSVAPAKINLNIDLHTPLAISPKDSNAVYYISHHMLMAARTHDGGHTWQTGQFYSAGQIARFPMLANIKGMYWAPDGTLWLGCAEQICEADGDQVRLWGAAEGVPADVWSSILMSRNGDLWARGNRQIIRLTKGSRRFADADSEIPNSVVEVRGPCLLEDPQGRMLANVATGLARWDKGHWSLFTEQNGLPGGLIQTMIFDRQGSLWFDGGKTGLARWIGYGDWESWTTEDGLSNNLIWQILRDSRGRLWVGGELDLVRLNLRNGRQVLERTGDNLHVRRVQSIRETADKHLWIGSDDGSIVEYDPNRGTSRLISKQRNVYQILVDKEDRVWVLAASGLFWVDRSSPRRTLQVPPSGAPPSTRFYRSVQGPNGEIIFTSDQGLFLLKNGTWSHLELPASFRSGYNTQIARGRNGTYWITGTSPALLQFKLDGTTAVQVSAMSPPALVSGNVYMLSSDPRGWLWVGTDSGLDVFNGAEWRQVDETDGLIWNDTDTDAFLADTDGSVWIGTSGGLSHLMHPEDLFAKEPLNVKLSQVKLGKADLRQGEAETVKWGHYPLTFHVETSDFARGQSIVYRYQLIGVDDVPQQTTDNDIRYSFVPDGRHRLVVTAVDPGTRRVSPEQIVAFTIRPPWWRTPLFFVLVALLVVLIVVIAWLWSNRNATARRHALERLVQERTRELEEKNASLLDARAALIEQATRDSLTGILNRGAIYSVMEKEIERAHREAGSVVVVLADVDHFKKVNDVYGHQFGDHVLREITSRIGASIRSYDSLGRYGGEEFLIVLPQLGMEESKERLEHLRQIIEEEPVVWREISLQVTCSFGATNLAPGADSQSMVHEADLALYRAKANGRNRVEFSVAKEQAESERY